LYGGKKQQIINSHRLRRRRRWRRWWRCPLVKGRFIRGVRGIDIFLHFLKQMLLLGVEGLASLQFRQHRALELSVILRCRPGNFLRENVVRRRENEIQSPHRPRAIYLSTRRNRMVSRHVRRRQKFCGGENPPTHPIFEILGPGNNDRIQRVGEIRREARDIVCRKLQLLRQVAPLRLQVRLHIIPEDRR
jgi:hypothetical protein